MSISGCVFSFVCMEVIDARTRSFLVAVGITCCNSVDEKMNVNKMAPPSVEHGNADIYIYIFYLTFFFF